MRRVYTAHMTAASRHAPVPRRAGGERPLRLFLALWPDEATAASLEDWTRALLPRCGGRAMRRDTLHLTLAFLGPTGAARARELAGALGAWRAESGSFAVVRAGRFNRLRLVWAGPHEHGPDADRLARLHASLWDWLAPMGWRPELPFRPHVTLLRDAGPPPPDFSPGPVAWRYDRVALAASVAEPAGPARYRILATSLGGRPGPSR